MVLLYEGLIRAVTVSKTHGTIISQYQVHDTVFIVVLNKSKFEKKNAAYYYLNLFCRSNCFSLTLPCFLYKLLHILTILVVLGEGEN